MSIGTLKIFDAVAAFNATVWHLDYLLLEGNQFRIMTPQAFQRTPLKKHRCANTVPVVNGKTLDIGNDRRFHTNASA
jgi:hypothetical protein